MITRFWCILGLCLVAGCNLYQPRPTAPVSLWVDPHSTANLERGDRQAPYKTLDKALAKAGEGTTLYLAPTEYSVTLTLDDEIALECEAEEPATLIAADPTQPVLKLAPEANARLVNLRLRGGSAGVVAGGQSSLRMERCEVIGNNGPGVQASQSSLRRGTRPLLFLEHCRLTGNAVGISLVNAYANVILCELSENQGPGAEIAGRSQCQIAGNRVFDNGGHGLRLDLARKCELSLLKNHVENNGGDGIHINGAALPASSRYGVDIEQNQLISNDRYGIYVETPELEPDEKFDPEPAVRLEKNEYQGNGRDLTRGIEAR